MRKSCFLLLSLYIVGSAIAGEILDDFTSPTLNGKIWVVKKAGKANYEIKDSVLILTSPSVPDGILIYYKEDLDDQDVVIETKAKGEGLVDNGGTIGFFDAIVEPDVNTTMWTHYLTQFWVFDGRFYIKADPEIVGQKGPNPPNLQGNYSGDWHLFKIVNKEKEVDFYVDDKFIGTVTKNEKIKSRYFMVTPDHYTTHYSGTLLIDYIKLSGPSIFPVEPMDKLSVRWGEIKLGLTGGAVRKEPKR